jgi:hypothetical protein
MAVNAKEINMATRKPRKFDKGGVTEGQNPNIDDETRERARKFVEGIASEKVTEPKTKSVQPKETTKPAAKSSSVVTKKQLEESGLSLRDYMNRERGLTRRGESSPAAAKPAPEEKMVPAKVTDTGSDIDRMLARAPAPAKAASAEKKSSYESPYDRMNRQNREAAAARKRAADDERATLRENVREGRSGKVNPKTLLPEAGMKKGGAVRGWGMARGARKAKIV